MVQRTATNKLVGSLTEPKRTHVKAERHLPSPLQKDTRSKGGGGDLKKKMKKMRSIKVSDLASLEGSVPGHKHARFDESFRPKRTSLTKISDGSPNYMKPTSSSHARKERPQVTVHSPTTTEKNPSSRNSKNLNHSNPSTSSPADSDLKPFKILSRKPSLKRTRPLVKKSSGVVLHPQKVVNRATCSSTLKDSKFPKALDLNLGGTEAEGPSVMRVCPYDYCSLNGHTHAPLPPLKSFMSAGRKLLKTQKSFKLKGLPSFRVKGSGKDEKGIDTGQMGIIRTTSGLVISTPLIEEIANDFFVEIYTKPQERALELEKCDERSTQMEDHRENPRVDELSLIQEDEGWRKGVAEEDNEGDALNQTDESYSDIGLQDDLDQKSDVSTDEMDVMMNFLEYVECDPQVEAEEENHPSLVPEDYAEWCFECYIFDVLGKDSEGLAESETIVSTFGATDINWEEEEVGPFLDNKTDYSEYPDDALGSISLPLPENKNTADEFSFYPDIFSNACEIAEADAEQLLELSEEIVEEGNTSDGNSESNDADSHDDKERSRVDVPFCLNVETSDSLVQNQSADVWDQDPKPLVPESSEENQQGDELIIEGTEPLSSKQNISDLSFLGCEEEDSEEREEGSEMEDAFPGRVKDDNDIFEGEALEPADMETKQNLDVESLGQSILSNSIKEEENRDDEVEDTSSLSILQLSESLQGSTETDKDMEEWDHIQTKLETEECKSDEAIEDPTSTLEIHNPFIDQSDEDNTERNRKKSEKEQEEVDGIEGSISKAAKHDCLEMNGVIQIEDDVESDADDIFLLSSNKSSEEDKTINTATAKSNQPLTGAVDKPKARIRIIRKRATEESEQMKEFNPRPPQFLPIELDPEAEKVDLRHQMMEDRKNAEEWMVDYALQQAVSKLAPARKRKVALLVEAFETVMPLPMCEEPLRHTSSGFAHARTMQACS